MENFKKTLFSSRRISVWGAGYLGYTKILKLQHCGFSVDLFDYTNIGIKNKIKTTGYPDKEQIYSWSVKGNIPRIDPNKINIKTKASEMFNTNVHILAFPVTDKNGSYNFKKVLDIFTHNSRRLRNSLVILQSAGVPGAWEKGFIVLLKKKVKNLYFVSAFRSDWSIEEFLNSGKKRVIAADCSESLQKGIYFYGLLNTEVKVLPSIEAAELYENAKNALQYVNTTFINQLSFAYPSTNIREMTRYILDDLELNETHLSVGAGGCKIPVSVENVLRGSKNPQFLSIIKESQESNISMILVLAEKIKRMRCKSVTIMGLSIKGNQKDIEFSPSVVIAEYLNKLGIKVLVDDPLYNSKSVKDLMPYSEKVDVLRSGLRSEVLLLMTDHDEYRYISQQDIDSLGISKARLIVDNTEILSGLSFSSETVYYLVGEGKIGKI